MSVLIPTTENPRRNALAFTARLLVCGLLVVLGKATRSSAADVDFHNLDCFAWETHSSPGALSLEPDWVFPYESIANNAWWQSNFYLSGAYSYVSGVGDVNGDVYDDIVIGFEYLRARPGVAVAGGTNFEFPGATQGTASEPEWEAVLPQYPLWDPIVPIGDVNGDGYNDVAIRNQGWRAGDSSTENGEVLIYIGGSLGLSAEPTWRFQGHGDQRYFGANIAGGGDVNGDGYADFFFAYAKQLGVQEYWRYILGYAGTAAGPVLTWTFSDETAHFWDNADASHLGDINHDGFAELQIVIDGAYTPLLYWGSSDGPVDQPQVLSSTYVGVGDVNGDGYDDTIGPCAGEPPDCLALHVGSETGISSNSTWELERGPGGHWGGVRAIGDINNDGFADFLISVDSCINLWVYLGSPNGPGDTPAWRITDTWYPSESWQDVCLSTHSGMIGDVNGDGYDDVAVSLRCMGDEFFGMVSDQYVFFGGYDPTTTTTSTMASTTTTTTSTIPAADDESDDDSTTDDDSFADDNTENASNSGDGDPTSNDACCGH